jgi:hypothetical protein
MAPGDVGVGVGEATRGHPHRLRHVLIGLAIAGGVVVVLVALLGWWWAARGPGRPSIEGAVDRFQSTSTSFAARGPRPGVYVYASRGDEDLSFLSTHQSQDGNLPATVVARSDGCFDFTIEYNSFHRQSWTRCETDGRFVERQNVTEQEFDFGPFSQHEHTEISCSPPTVFPRSARVGSSTPVRCTGTSSTTDATQRQRGTLTFVGPATVRVGDARVPALHFRQEVRIGGEQHGSSREEVWLAASDGLPLRESRRITVVSPAPSPIGEVTYTEQGEWRLTSLEPRS